MKFKGLTVSNEGVDVSNVVDQLLNPRQFEISVTTKVSIYTINNVGFTFNLENGHVIMRLVGQDWALIYLTQWQNCVQNIFAVTGQNALLLLPLVRYCATSAKTGCADVVSIGASLTKAPHWEAQWLSSILPTRLAFTKPCPASILPLLELSSTLTRSKKQAHSNLNRQSCSQVSRKSYRPKSIRTFSKTCTSLNLTIGTASAKSGRRGTKNCATLMTFSLKPQNAKSSLRNNARNADSRSQFKPDKPAFIGRVFACLASVYEGGAE